MQQFGFTFIKLASNEESPVGGLLYLRQAQWARSVSL